MRPHPYLPGYLLLGFPGFGRAGDCEPSEVRLGAVTHHRSLWTFLECGNGKGAERFPTSPAGDRDRKVVDFDSDGRPPSRAERLWIVSWPSRPAAGHGKDQRTDSAPDDGERRGIGSGD